MVRGEKVGWLGESRVRWSGESSLVWLRGSRVGWLEESRVWWLGEIKVGWLGESKVGWLGDVCVCVSSFMLKRTRTGTDRRRSDLLYRYVVVHCNASM